MRLQILKDRAAMMSSVRSFFSNHKVLEVDCPILSSGASIDAHIDLISAIYHKQDMKYLHSSPEYGMKRLLVEGIGDCYQLSHVFRDGEWGHKHNPEFMMIEWYRLGFSFDQIIQETCDLIQLFLGKFPIQILSYREALKKFAGFDYLSLSKEELLKKLKELPISLYLGIEKEDRDALLNIVLAQLVEPQLGDNCLTALIHYPASQAALAKTIMKEEELVAERFEVYFKGIELCNGYHELADSNEQELRFHESNQYRQMLGKESLPLDTYFLSALKKGLPDCCGVAVGFDRLMMLKHKCSSIEDVLPFAWNQI